MTNRIRAMIAGLVFMPFLVNAGQANIVVTAKIVYNCSMQTVGSGIEFCTNNSSMPSKQKFDFENSAVVLVKDGYITVNY